MLSNFHTLWWGLHCWHCQTHRAITSQKLSESIIVNARQILSDLHMEAWSLSILCFLTHRLQCIKLKSNFYIHISISMIVLPPPPPLGRGTTNTLSDHTLSLAMATQQWELEGWIQSKRTDLSCKLEKKCHSPRIPPYTKITHGCGRKVGEEGGFNLHK